MRGALTREPWKGGGVTGTSGGGEAAVPDAPRPETAELLDGLGVPLGPELMKRALTHRSFAYENGGLPTHQRAEVPWEPGPWRSGAGTPFPADASRPRRQLGKVQPAG